MEDGEQQQAGAELAAPVPQPVPSAPAVGESQGNRASLASLHIAKLQVDQTVKAIPLLLLFHASAVLSIENINGLMGGGLFQSIWYAGAVATALTYAGAFMLWRRRKPSVSANFMLRLLELVSLIFGLLWAVPVATATSVDAAAVLPLAGITLAVMGIGVISLIRVPVGAVIFTALLTAALARSLYSAMSEYQTMAALVCAIYGLVLIGITLNSHWDFLRRSRMELEVQHQKQVIKLLLNDFERGSSDWLWETNAEGYLTHFSPRFADILNLPLADMRGKTLSGLLQPVAVDDALLRLEHAMGERRPISGLNLSLDSEGRRTHWQIVAHPLEAGGVFRGFRGVGRDVTLMQDAQRHMQQAMEASERANAAKSQFLAVVSHELRTPLNAIVGFGELLMKDSGATLAPAARREYSETIVESAKHLQLLINDLLDATRIERGTLTLVEQENDACEMVEIAIKLCRSQAEKGGVTLVGRLVDFITITGDATRLQQVIINLLTNAIKFSPRGGVVNVEMMRGSEGQFILAVKDAGPGISAEDLQRVFDPFVQADDAMTRRHGGIGLGLSIARRIARLHDGDVRLESAPGAGTTALLILPAARVTWPKSASKPAQSVA